MFWNEMGSTPGDYWQQPMGSPTVSSYSPESRSFFGGGGGRITGPMQYNPGIMPPNTSNQSGTSQPLQIGYENLSATPMQYNIRPQQQAYRPSYGMPQNMVGMNNTPFVPRGLSGLTHYRGLF